METVQQLFFFFHANTVAKLSDHCYPLVLVFHVLFPAPFIPCYLLHYSSSTNSVLGFSFVGQQQKLLLFRKRWQRFLLPSPQPPPLPPSSHRRRRMHKM